MKLNRIGTASWGFREMELAQQLACVRSHGFGIHELAIANAPGDLPLDADAQQLEEVKALYRSYGIRLICAATGNDFTAADAGRVREDVSKVKKVIDICGKTGALYLRIFAGFAFFREVTGQRWMRMTEALNEVAAYAKSKGVVLGVETHGGVREFSDGVEHFASVTTEYDTLRRLLEAVDGSVQFVYDPANLYAAGEKDTEKILNLLSGRVCCIHCKEFVVMPSGHLRPAACGDTDMDWKKVMRSLEDFEGPILMEYEKTEDAAEGCRRSAEHLRRVFGVSSVQGL